MKKHIPNFITCLNLLTGAAGCISVLQGDYHQAIYFVVIAGVFDFFDGFAARLLKVQSAIGKELDSLADMVSFGLLPALYMVMAITNLTDIKYLPYLGLMIAAFSALRLAKFNIDDRQTDQFIGVPTPANTIMITSLSLLPTSLEPNLVILIGITIASSLLLVSPIPMIALKFKGAAWNQNKDKYILIAILLVAIAIFQLSALPMLIPVYVLFSAAKNALVSQK